MAQCKICPNCGEINGTGAWSCKKCDMDLSSVSISNDSITVEYPTPPEEQQREERQEQQHKTCSECGGRNPSQARKCQHCGADISDIIPTSEEDFAETHYEFKSLDGDYSFQIPCGCSVIGREHEMREYLAAKPFVSRIHAKLIVEDGKLFIENQSSTNYTFVNNIKIPSGRTLLKTGDEVSLGGITVNGIRQSEAAYFIVGTVL